MNFHVYAFVILSHIIMSCAVAIEFQPAVYKLPEDVGFAELTIVRSFLRNTTTENVTVTISTLDGTATGDL